MSRTSSRVSSRLDRRSELVKSVFKAKFFTNTVPAGNVQVPVGAKAICCAGRDGAAVVGHGQIPGLQRRHPTTTGVLGT